MIDEDEKPSVFKGSDFSMNDPMVIWWIIMLVLAIMAGS